MHLLSRPDSQRRWGVSPVEGDLIALWGTAFGTAQLGLGTTSDVPAGDPLLTQSRVR
jgi:hypothetical protein